MFDDNATNIKTVSVSQVDGQAVVTIELRDADNLDSAVETISIAVVDEVRENAALATLKARALGRAVEILQQEVRHARREI